MAMDLRLVRGGLRIAAIGAVLLFVFLFFFDWYGVGGVFGALAERLGIKATVNGWHGHTDLRWLMLLTIVATLGLALMAATGRKLSLPVAPSAILTALAGLTTILVAYRVIINEPGPNKYIDVKAGAWLGLLSLVAIAVGAYLSMREEGVSLSDAGEQARSAVSRMTAPDAAEPAAEAAPADTPPTASA
jgi:hypothetical protein